MSITRTLGEFFAGVTFDDLPDTVRQQAKKCLLDYIGTNLAGARGSLAPAVLDLVREMGGEPQCTLIACGKKASLFWATAANGTLAHSLELDDGHILAHAHPGVATIPAAMALAERNRLGGRALLTAVALGYEPVLRIGDAITPAVLYERGFHSAALVAPFGAAVACGHLLGFDTAGMTAALANCALGPIVPMETFSKGAALKDWYGGWPAAAGLFAALLAAKGTSGTPNYLEGRRGFLQCVVGTYDSERITRKLGSEWNIMDVYFKKYASCSLSHTTVDAALKLRASHDIPIDQIESIRVGTHVMACELSERTPVSPQQAKFSLPFVVAVALLRGQVMLAEFDPATLSDNRVLSLARKVTVGEEPAHTQLHLAHEDRRPSTVAVHLRDGQVLKATVAVARGWPENPMSEEEFREKYMTLATQALSSQRAAEVWSLVQDLEHVGDVTVLTHLLS